MASRWPFGSAHHCTGRGREQEGLALRAVAEAQAGQVWAELLCRQREGGERRDRVGLAMWSALCVGFLPIVGKCREGLLAPGAEPCALQGSGELC